MVHQIDSTTVLQSLQKMDDYEFEHLVADLWEHMGWNTVVSQASLDAGIDVTATKQSPYPEKQLIQAKRYGPNTTVGSPEIQQYASLKQQGQNVDTVVVVTTNGFSKHALNLAGDLNVKTVNGRELVALISENEAFELLSKYSLVSSSRQPTVDLSDNSTSSSKSEQKWWEKLANREGMMERRSPDTHLKIIKAATAMWGLYFGIIIVAILLGVEEAVTEGAAIQLVNLPAVCLGFLCPFSFFYEGKRVRNETHWDVRFWFYSLAAWIPAVHLFLGAVYLRRRKRAYRVMEEQEVQQRKVQIAD